MHRLRNAAGRLNCHGCDGARRGFERGSCRMPRAFRFHIPVDPPEIGAVAGDVLDYDRAFRMWFASPTWFPKTWYATPSAGFASLSTGSDVPHRVAIDDPLPRLASRAGTRAAPTTARYPTGTTKALLRSRRKTEPRPDGARHATTTTIPFPAPSSIPSLAAARSAWWPRDTDAVRSCAS